MPSSGRLADSYNPAKNLVNKSSIEIHQKLEKARMTRRLKVLICYICNKEFNIKKIEDHIKICKAKWETGQQLRKPESRLPLPAEPMGFREALIFHNARQSIMNESVMPDLESSMCNSFIIDYRKQSV